METEQLKIFDENRNPIGIASREEVHRLGYWHETFHCWFISKDQEKDYLYLQLRSKIKKDYPNLLDITAAGHLLASESVEDGVREIKEEVGIDITPQELIPLGIIDYSVLDGDFIDKEFAHTFLYKSEKNFEDFILQDEVAGIVKVEFNEFVELWLDERPFITITGFEVTENGNKIYFEEQVGKEKFVPHQNKFYRTVLEKMRAHI
ncbi:NUDIX domain-containing protein [Neobacillus niacini]|uniref:NUDIX hydrolase n=1 Tax=Neobacillus niacini TaxID=86668 RepID=UPI00052F79F2|nr:NUDIX domain-containing protein [Neobacillus niacini]KGM44957.1 NUDIX hydrolase [Neobacillus niacini]MEC1520776.1 NUDIX domain-containing protein [Neobacillus niacini]